MISQAKVFFSERVNIGWFFYSAAGPAVLQHAFYDGVGSFTVMTYLLFIFIDTVGYFFCTVDIACLQLVISVINSEFTSEKLLTKFNGF